MTTPGGRPTSAQPVRHFQRGDRSLLGRLQHAGATRGQRRRQLPGRHQQRIIPRNDLARDADRFLERKAHGVVGNRIHVSENFGGQSAVVLKAGGNVGDVVFRFDDRLAGVAGFQFRQHRQVLADLFGETEEHAAAFLRRRGRPRAIFEGGFGGGDGAVHVVGVGVRGLRDHFFAGGIVDRESLVGLAVDPLAVDVELVGAYVGFHSAGHEASFDVELLPSFARPHGRDARAHMFCFAAAVHVEEECRQSDEEQRAAKHPYFIRPQRTDLLCREKYQHDSQRRRHQAADAGKHQRRLAVVPRS